MTNPRYGSKVRVSALVVAALVLLLYVYLRRQESHHDSDFTLDFAFEPVERFDLENVKYSWALAAVVVVALTVAIS